MTNPVNLTQQSFESLASAMEYIGRQEVKVRLRDKVYLSMEGGDRYVTKMGKQGKREKGIKAEEIVKKVQEVVSEAEKTGLFLKTSSQAQKTVENLSHVVKGLEGLRSRIRSHQKSTPMIIRFILNFFGVEDKTDNIVRQINSAINSVNRHRLTLQIELLEQEMAEILQTITQLQTAQAKSPLNKIKARYEQEVQAYTQQLLEKSIQRDTKLQEYESQAAKKLGVQIQGNWKALKAKQKIELEKLKQQLKEAEKEKEAAGRMKGAKEKSLFKDSPARTAYKKALKVVKETQKQIESAQKNLNRLEGFKRGYEIERQLFDSQIKQIQEKKEELEAQLNAIKQDLSKEDKVIEFKKKEFDIKRSQLEQQELQLQALPVEVNYSPLSFSQLVVRVKSPLFELPSTASSTEQQFALFIQSLLGLTNDKKSHESYQRRLIFGFSVGHKKTIQELTRLHPDFNVEHLEQMLEGGTGLINMYYIAHYLNTYIESLESKGQNVDYIKKLKELQTDLQRSLPLAFRARIIEMECADQPNDPHAKEELIKLQKEICSELDKMKPPAKLYLPIGTKEHETLLILQKTSDEQVKAITYNTGDGADENIEKGINLKAFTDFLSAGFFGKAPVKKSYPAADFKHEQFGEMLVEVLQNRLVGGSMATINQALTGYLNKGKSGPPKELQINGICAFQVLNEVLEDLLGNTYPQFQYDLLNHVQTNFEALTQELREQKNPGLRIVLRLHEVLLEDNQAEIQSIGKRIKA